VTKFFSYILAFVILVIFLTGCRSAADAELEALNAAAFAANDRIGRGVNLGNALDGPSEGAWGLYLKAEYFSAIAEAGFDSVRVPIRFSKYTEINEPYAIQENILVRVDWVIQQATDNNLAVIINVHHFDAMMQMPEIQIDRLAAMWRQIGERYQDYPNTLYFEILNEPHEKLDGEIWNQAFLPALTAIRETNPERYVIIGPDGWNNINNLAGLELPVKDRYIIGTFHYYLPHEFTHQGASWSSAYDVKDRPWGSDEEIKDLRNAFDGALAWSETQGRPLYIGEFGSFYAAPMESRSTWTAAIRTEAEKRGFSWSYWDFGTDFAVYNLSNHTWREPILQALIPPE